MSKRTSAKPICQACNRPFDPRSEGATLTMGPTCAKRANLSGPAEKSPQLSFLGDDLGTMAMPPRPKFRSRLPKRTLPADLREGYQLAKMAFDELFREFCTNGSLLQGNLAIELEREVLFEGCEVHSLADPVLGWLEPEFQVQLLIIYEDGVAYHRREINGVVTMLMCDFATSDPARRNIRLITEFTAAVRKHHEGPQLSLLELGS